MLAVLVGLMVSLMTLLAVLTYQRVISLVWVPAGAWAIASVLVMAGAWVFQAPTAFVVRTLLVALVAGAGGTYWMRRAVAASQTASTDERAR